MKQLFSIMLVGMLIITFSVCSKQVGTESFVDKAAKLYGQIESVETTEQAKQEQLSASEITQTANDLASRDKQQPQI